MVEAYNALTSHSLSEKAIELKVLLDEVYPHWMSIPKVNSLNMTFTIFSYHFLLLFGYIT